MEQAWSSELDTLRKKHAPPAAPKAAPAAPAPLEAEASAASSNFSSLFKPKASTGGGTAGGGSRAPSKAPSVADLTAFEEDQHLADELEEQVGQYGWLVGGPLAVELVVFVVVVVVVALSGVGPVCVLAAPPLSWHLR